MHFEQCGPISKEQNTTFSPPRARLLRVRRENTSIFVCLASLEGKRGASGQEECVASSQRLCRAAAVAAGFRSLCTSRMDEAPKEATMCDADDASSAAAATAASAASAVAAALEIRSDEFELVEFAVTV
jgi:hypothetical protein